MLWLKKSIFIILLLFISYLVASASRTNLLCTVQCPPLDYKSFRAKQWKRSVLWFSAKQLVSAIFNLTLAGKGEQQHLLCLPEGRGEWGNTPGMTGSSPLAAASTGIMSALVKEISTQIIPIFNTQGRWHPFLWYMHLFYTTRIWGLKCTLGAVTQFLYFSWQKTQQATVHETIAATKSHILVYAVLKPHPLCSYLIVKISTIFSLFFCAIHDGQQRRVSLYSKTCFPHCGNYDKCFSSWIFESWISFSTDL